MNQERPRPPPPPRPPAQAQTSAATGAKAPAAPPPGTRNTQDFSRYLLDQGRTNACGTTSGAMLMNFWNQTPGKTQHGDLDRSIRRYDMFTSPQNLVDHYNANGFRAAGVNNATVDQLASFVDKGVPVQVLYDPSGERAGGNNDPYLHYVNVVGINRGADGSIASVKIADPGGGTLTDVPLATFQKRWDDLQLQGVGTGINNAMVVMMPGDSVPVRGADGTIRQTKDIALPAGTGFGARGWLADKASDAANGVHWGVEQGGKAKDWAVEQGQRAADGFNQGVERAGRVIDDVRRRLGF